MYFATPSSVFEKAGIRLVIWANHLLRSAITAMQHTAATIHQDQSLFNVEGEVASVKRIFELQGAAELDAAEARYLPEVGTRTRAIVLAASSDPEFGDLVKDRPKCMIEINGRSLLERQLSIIRGSGVRDITVVRGYCKERIAFDGVAVVDNNDFATTGAGDSLQLALKHPEPGPVLVAFGDIVYRKHVLQSLLDDEGDFTLVVDLESKSSKLKPRGDYVRLSRVPGHRGMPDDEPILLKDVVIDDSADGEVIGLLRLSRAGCSWMHAAMQQLKVQNPKGRLVLTDIIRSVLKAGHSVRVQPIWGNWVDVNDLKDLAAASRY
jgi:phosphoenolpyruvate phosphomutase